MKWCNDMNAKHSLKGRRRAAGFTLIELVIAVAIIALLAAVAVPSYTAYIVRGKRAEAKTALLQYAQALERNYTVAGCYNFTDTTACAAQGPTATGVAVAITVAVPSGSYLVQPQPVAGGLAQTTFLLAATPCTGQAGCAAGVNFVDPDCGELRLDNIGQKWALGGAAGPAGSAAASAPVAASCWQR